MDLNTITGIVIDDLENVPIARGVKGDKGEQGDIGIGIMNIVANEDHTITVNYTDGTSEVINIPKSIKGEKGDKPVKGVDYFTQEDIEAMKKDVFNSKANKKMVWNLTLDTAWEGSAPFTKEIQVEGLSEKNMVYLYPVWSQNIEVREMEKKEYSKINMVESKDGSVILTCDEDKPSINLNVRLESEDTTNILNKDEAIDYNTLSNKPSINNVTLVKNKTLDDLGAPSEKLSNEDLNNILI